LMMCGRAASLTCASKIDLIALSQTIQGATIDPEKLGGELLVASGLRQYALNVTLHSLSKAQGGPSHIVCCAGCPSELRWEVLGEEDGIGREGDGLLDDML
jgi:hypothetical protein